MGARRRVENAARRRVPRLRRLLIARFRARRGRDAPGELCQPARRTRKAQASQPNPPAARRRQGQASRHPPAAILPLGGTGTATDSGSQGEATATGSKGATVSGSGTRATGRGARREPPSRWKRSNGAAAPLRRRAEQATLDSEIRLRHRAQRARGRHQSGRRHLRRRHVSVAHATSGGGPLRRGDSGHTLRVLLRSQSAHEVHGSTAEAHRISNSSAAGGARRANLGGGGGHRAP